MREGLADRVAGDFVKEHAVKFPPLAVEQFLQVLTNGFAFAVRVGGQIHGLGLFRRRFQLLNDLAFAGDGDVLGLEIFLQVDAQLLFGQVFDVPHGSFYGEIRAEVFVDGLRLGGRFDDDE